MRLVKIIIKKPCAHEPQVLDDQSLSVASAYNIPIFEAIVVHWFVAWWNNNEMKDLEKLTPKNSYSLTHLLTHLLTH